MITNFRDMLQTFVHWLWGQGAIKFGLYFVFGTFVLAVTLLNLSYNFIDLGFKINFFSVEKAKSIYFSFLFLFWVVSIFCIAAFITSFGSQILRYFIVRDRVSDLKTSNLFTRTKVHIDLMGLSLMPFTSQDWSNCFEEKLLAGVKMRLLIVDPCTEYAKNRHSSVSNANLSEDIELSIKAFKVFFDKFIQQHGQANAKFQLRKYKNNPSMSLFIFDSEVRLGLLLEKDTGLTAPEIRLHNHGKQVDLFNKVQKHYDDIWAKSTEII
jgi:hypothetical protein